MPLNDDELNKYEREILQDFEKDEFESVADLEDEMVTAKAAAKNFMHKQSRINLKVASADLNMLKKIAVQEGLPYQILISSILHKFVAGRLKTL